MKVLITGADGQLGRDFQRLQPEAAAYSREQLSVLDLDAFRAALRSDRPEIVINCAAYNAVDRAETEPEAAFAVNGAAPGLIAAACREAGVRLVHFSTNFVFDGRATIPYTEEAPPRPLSVYAESKLEGERRVLEELPSALVVRTAGLFGTGGSRSKGGSFPARILARARAGEPLKVVADQTLNPTYTGHLARRVLELAGREVGIVHLVAVGCCSWFEFAVEVLRRAGFDRPVEPLTSAQLSAPARRPRQGCLSSMRVAELPHWREGVAAWFEAGG